MMAERIVQITINITTFLYNAQVIGLSLTKGTGKLGQSALGTTGTLLNGMLRIIPPAKVPPNVVVGVVIAESNQEAFVA